MRASDRAPSALPAPATLRYLAFVALAGGLCIILSLVGLRGFLTGMLSGLVALAVPDAAGGGRFTIGAPDSDAALCASAVAATPADAASKTPAPIRANAFRPNGLGVLIV
ncbi:hypothetical protein BN2476_830068 [Paraburkholderia piptadeniae]|uniref:Uncharacterized protein n=1 Tax=Paraburkholderia piptadeniae TaxID=1701573 RepID=A0A1N7SUA1_9BURK|nr:hypothetical protein [Paraburkholderia piptadeniae]SIT50497.1 hypothetical protein BN2476_830068 [Paraburkholderia piptadeniae]